MVVPLTLANGRLVGVTQETATFRYWPSGFALDGLRSFTEEADMLTDWIDRVVP